MLILVTARARRSVGVPLLTLFCTLMLAGVPVHAQSDIDVEPPVVELEQIDSGRAGTRQEFTARVIDDRRIAEVLLYFRFAGEETFENVPMRAVGSSSLYSAMVTTGQGDTRDIEYYIQARDEAGNRVIKGYAFSPLVRTMGADPVDAAPAPASNAPLIRKRWFYIGLGVLAVGAAAAYLGKDDSKSNGPNVFTLIVEVPEGL